MATLNEILGPNWQQQAAAYTYHGQNNQLQRGGAVPFTLADGKTYFLQKQTGPDQGGPGGYVLFTDNGSTNLQYGEDGNFQKSYAGNEAGITLGDIIRGVGTIGAGMGLGALASAGGAAGAAGAASAASGEGAALGGAGTGISSGIGSTGSLAGTAGAGAAAGGAESGVTVGGPMSVGGATGTPLPSMGAMGGVGTTAAAGGGLGGLLPAGTTLGDLAKVAGGVAGVAGAIQGGNAQSDAANSMLDYLRAQQAKIDGLYAPGSPEYNSLMEQMRAKDAAAGRNSQYGIRAVDLAGKIAQTKAQYTAGLTGSTAGNMQTAFNQNASSNAGLNAVLGNLTQPSGNGGGSFIDSLSKFF